MHFLKIEIAVSVIGGRRDASYILNPLCMYELDHCLTLQSHILWSNFDIYLFFILSCTTGVYQYRDINKSKKERERNVEKIFEIMQLSYTQAMGKWLPIAIKDIAEKKSSSAYNKDVWGSFQGSLSTYRIGLKQRSKNEHFWVLDARDSCPYLVFAALESLKSCLMEE